MIRFSHWILASAFALAACGPASAPPASQSATPAAATPGDRLTRLVDGYWDEYQRLNPRPLPQAPAVRYDPAGGYEISVQFLADSLALERRYLDAVLTVPRAALRPDSQLTYDLFKRQRELAVESFTYPAELMPVNPFRSLPLEFARAGAQSEPAALSSAKDFDNWQARTEQYVRWTDEAIANMREGMRRGYTSPRVLVAEMLPMLAALGVDSPASVFYQPIRSIPNTVPASERKRFTEGITAAARDRILPAYRLLHDFLRDEYLPRARESVGLSVLPLGESWYAFVVRRETASRLAPGEIHALAVAETERLHARLQTLLAEAGFAGNAQAYLEATRREPQVAYQTPEELLNFYGQLKTEVAAAIAASFAPAPHADFALRPLQSLRAAGAPALSYERAPDQNSPAILYVDTATVPLIPETAAFLREALPGYHYQIALQAERTDLPRFRRFGGAPAFVEGWGLYAESLGEELGLYRDTESKFAALSDQLRCAAGMVVDTGLHSLGWSREQAFDYLRAQAPIDEAAAHGAGDRAAALPGEALACGMGARAIRELRGHAQQVLGARFDVREFHSALTDNGAMPLDILESTVNLWLSGSH
jgi:uncharacterized protein (DUF885 family)